MKWNGLHFVQTKSTLKHGLKFLMCFNCQTELKLERTTPCFPAGIPWVGHAGPHGQDHLFVDPRRPGDEEGAGKLSLVKAQGAFHHPGADL